MSISKKEKKEFIDYALAVMEKVFIGLLVLAVIPFAGLFFGLIGLVQLYPNDTGRSESAAFFLGITIIYYYGMVGGVWLQKNIVAEGRLTRLSDYLWKIFPVRN